MTTAGATLPRAAPGECDDASRSRSQRGRIDNVNLRPGALSQIPPSGSSTRGFLAGSDASESPPTCPRVSPRGRARRGAGPGVAHGVVTAVISKPAVMTNTLEQNLPAGAGTSRRAPSGERAGRAGEAPRSRAIPPSMSPSRPTAATSGASTTSPTPYARMRGHHPDGQQVRLRGGPRIRDGVQTLYDLKGAEDNKPMSILCAIQRHRPVHHGLSEHRRRGRAAVQAREEVPRAVLGSSTSRADMPKVCFLDPRSKSKSSAQDGRVRVPSHPVTAALLERLDRPLLCGFVPNLDDMKRRRRAGPGADARRVRAKGAWVFWWTAA